MKIEFLLLPEYGEQSERKNEQVPLSFPGPLRLASGPRLAAMQRGNGHCYMESSLFSSRTRRGYINRRPCPRVRPRGHTTQRARWPGRRLDDIQDFTFFAYFLLESESAAPVVAAALAAGQRRLKSMLLALNLSRRRRRRRAGPAARADAMPVPATMTLGRYEGIWF